MTPPATIPDRPPKSEARQGRPASDATPEMPLRDRNTVADAVADALQRQPITDIHTHLYPAAFGTPSAGADGRYDAKGLMLWGIDELLTYHYLVAEVFRVVPSAKMPYETFWRMDKTSQADHIWRHLFLERSPVSEACRGVITTLSALGLDPAEKNLDGYRKWYAQQQPDNFIGKVMEVSGVESITMTNNVFDDNERRFWLDSRGNSGSDPRFRAAVRLDPLLCDWDNAVGRLREWGYPVNGSRSAADAEAGRRFLRDWIDRTDAIYCAASLGPEFRYPEAGAGGGAGTWALEQIVLPVCTERGMPLALMIGARRAVNPQLGDAGDSSGAADLRAVENLCAAFPQNKFLVTLLSRENQHELAVTARKFDNLMIFGCWWFLNTPSLIEEITQMRVELLGLSFIPQHSDARVLDQLIYKWRHSRQVLAKVLSDRYGDLQEAGWLVTAGDIQDDVRRLLHENFHEFLRR